MHEEQDRDLYDTLEPKFSLNGQGCAFESKLKLLSKLIYIIMMSIGSNWYKNNDYG